MVKFGETITTTIEGKQMKGIVVEPKPNEYGKVLVAFEDLEAELKYFRQYISIEEVAVSDKTLSQYFRQYISIEEVAVSDKTLSLKGFTPAEIEHIKPILELNAKYCKVCKRVFKKLEGLTKT